MYKTLVCVWFSFVIIADVFTKLHEQDVVIQVAVLFSLPVYSVCFSVNFFFVDPELFAFSFAC